MSEITIKFHGVAASVIGHSAIEIIKDNTRILLEPTVDIPDITGVIVTDIDEDEYFKWKIYKERGIPIYSTKAIKEYIKDRDLGQYITPFEGGITIGDVKILAVKLPIDPHRPMMGIKLPTYDLVIAPELPSVIPQAFIEAIGLPPAHLITGIGSFGMPNHKISFTQFREELKRTLRGKEKGILSLILTNFRKGLAEKKSQVMSVLKEDWDIPIVWAEKNMEVKYSGKNISTKSLDSNTAEKMVRKYQGKWCILHCHGAEAGTPIKCYPGTEEGHKKALAMHYAIEARKVKELESEDLISILQYCTATKDEDLFGSVLEEMAERKWNGELDITLKIKSMPPTMYRMWKRVRGRLNKRQISTLLLKPVGFKRLREKIENEASLRFGYKSRSKPAYRFELPTIFEDIKDSRLYGKDLLVDVKADGLRVTAEKIGGDAKVYVDPEDLKRKSPNVSKRLPAIIKELNEILPDNTVCDGELYSARGEFAQHRTVCLHGKTKILTSGGAIPISEIVNSKLQIRVLSYNIGSDELEFKDINGFHKTKGIYEWISISSPPADGGNSLLLTPDHNILTPEGWRRADSLHPNDKILIYSYRLSDEERQIIIGTLFGDGYLERKYRNAYLSIGHSIHQKEYAEKLAYLLSGLHPTIKQNPWKFTRICHNNLLTFTSSISLWTKHLDCLNEFSEFYDENRRKLIPKKYLDELDILGLSIWFMDDGSFSKSRKWNSYDVVLSTESFSWEENEMLVKYFKDRWNLVANHTKRNNLRFYGENAKWLVNNLMIKIDFKNHGKKNFNVYDIIRGNESHYFSQIRRIKHSKHYSPKYNLEIEDNHNYFADNILVKNCNGILNSKYPAEKLAPFVFLYIFDVLFWNGKDIQGLPLRSRLEYLSSLKNSEHIRIERIGESGRIVKSDDKEGLKSAIRSILNNRHSLHRNLQEGVMIKDYDSVYEVPQNHGWGKSKELYEVDAIAYDRTLVKDQTDVWNYDLGILITEDYYNKLPNKIKKEINGKHLLTFGRSDNTRINLNPSIRTVLRVASEEVNKFENEEYPSAPWYRGYINVAMQGVPEKHVSDSLEVLEKLAKFQPKRIPIQKLLLFAGSKSLDRLEQIRKRIENMSDDMLMKFSDHVDNQILEKWKTPYSPSRASGAELRDDFRLLCAVQAKLDKGDRIRIQAGEEVYFDQKTLTDMGAKLAREIANRKRLGKIEFTIQPKKSKHYENFWSHISAELSEKDKKTLLEE